MTSVFIVRPFGRKLITLRKNDGSEHAAEVDFDAVERSLIQAALRQNGLTGETTGMIAQAGNIRLDMFERLIASDLVIADISIDNANVFYELGIRHGLRPKGTILLRFPSKGTEVPFDLKTDRCIKYDWENPAAAVDQLAHSIADTLRQARGAEARADSPVFLLLPDLPPPDPSTLIVVPREFQDAVEKAEEDAANGRTTLALLAEEAKRTSWGREGLRLVGRAQRRRNACKAARDTWEFIREDLPDDVEANLMLATVYQRLGDRVTASQACRRVLDRPTVDRKDRADARAQLARNEKAAWMEHFSALPGEDERRRQATADPWLTDAAEGYLDGFAEDLNDYYSGINALGLLTAIVHLADVVPDGWAGRFPTAKKADIALDEYREQLERVRGAVRMSLDNAIRQQERQGKPDEWLPASEAQYWLLTAENPFFVRNAYLAAKNAAGSGFTLESEMTQVAIFHRLGLFPDNCRAAFAALGVTPEDLDKAARPAPEKIRDRVIVATGHRADAPHRSPPGRFPNTHACIAKAKAWLREAVAAEKLETSGQLSGIAGAASGVDLLFHAVCADLGIPTKVVLPIPVDAYCRRSVADGGASWVEAFYDLVAANPPIVLSDCEELPPWAQDIANYGIFQRGNIWMFEDALGRAHCDVSLIALWNQQSGEGPGGTADMVELAMRHGAKIVETDSKEIFALAV
jgi:hypothetical protein